MQTTQEENARSNDRILEFDLSDELKHGIVVSNLAYAVAAELGRDEEFCYQMAIAGMLHDIGKLKLTDYINGQEHDPLLIEELKYVRMHSSLGYEELKDQGYSDLVLQSILFIMKIMMVPVILPISEKTAFHWEPEFYGSVMSMQHSARTDHTEKHLTSVQ